MKFLPEYSVRNPVAVNLIMIFLLVVGAYYAFNITREFFPPTDVEIVYIGMAYPGSTPEEVERGITKRIEDAILDLQGIDKVTSNISEGNSAILVEVESGYDKRKLIDDIQREIDRITDFPEEALDPVVIDVEFTVPVIALTIFGEVSERRLKAVADEMEDVIRERVQVSAINMIGVRQPEISVEVDPALLNEHNLTFAEVAEAIRRSNLDLPAGEIKATDGRILLRTLGESDDAERIREIIVRSDISGTLLRVDDVAEVRDDYNEDKQLAFFRGSRAVMITIFKNRDQDAIRIAREVRNIVAEYGPRYAGESIRMEARADSSKFINERQQLLLRNGLQGLILVFICLAAFLDFSVAKWTAVGLPVSFMGTFIVMHLFGVTVNMISLFGLIIVIGLIVDDAIIIGENVFRHYEEGMPAHRAAIEGAKEVTWPVITAVTTTVVAFMPLLFLDGVIGDFLGQLPLVVIAALLVSLIEALIILPTHLAETLARMTERKQAGISRGTWIPTLVRRFWAFKEDVLGKRLPDAYEKWLRFTLHWRYVFISSMVAVLVATLGFIGSGILKFVFIQSTDSETVIVEVDMGIGTAAEDTAKVVEQLRAAAVTFPEVEGVLSLVGVSFRDDGSGAQRSSEGNGQLIIDLYGAEYRDRLGLRSSDEFIAAMRAAVGEIPGANSIKYASAQGGPPGADIELEVRAPDFAMLESAVAQIRDKLASYDGVADIEDTLEPGKLEVRIRLRPAAEALGLSVRDVATQVRGAFFGSESQSLQRDREEVKVYVRLNREARERLETLDALFIRTPSGDRVPLTEVATLELTRGYSLLTRIDGRRAVKISCDVDERTANTTEITNNLDPFLRELQQIYPQLSFEYSGEKKKTADAFGSLNVTAPAALLIIYCMLATVFHSYTQPLIIMAAIPFGIVGAVWGHPIMGYPLTILSMIGIVALSGIVVNDALVLVDFVNEEVRQHHTNIVEAVVQGGRTRLRPILLTSLTTVFGLAPLMLEGSFQAQFLIPMAVSISFGLAFATVITLVMVPCLYMFVEDVRSVLRWLRTGHYERAVPIGMQRAHLEEAIKASYVGYVPPQEEDLDAPRKP